MEVSSLSLDGTVVDRRPLAKVRTQDSKESETTDDSSNTGLSAFEIDGVEVIDIYPIEEEDGSLDGNDLNVEPKITIEDIKKEKSNSFKMETNRRSSIAAKSSQMKKKLSQLHLFGKKVKRKDKRKTSKPPQETPLFEETSTMTASVVSESPSQPVKKNEPLLPPREGEATPNESEATDDADEESSFNNPKVVTDGNVSDDESEGIGSIEVKTNDAEIESSEETMLNGDDEASEKFGVSEVVDDPDLEQVEIMASESEEAKVKLTEDRVLQEETKLGDEESLQITEEESKAADCSLQPGSLPSASPMKKDDSIISATQYEAKKRSFKPMNFILCGRLDTVTTAV